MNEPGAQRLEPQRPLSEVLDAVIVGGGITGLATALRLQESGCRWLLVEREDRFGGKIATDRVDGFVIEGGPDCFLAAKPAGLELCRELGLEDRLVGSASSRRTFIKREGRLHELPAGFTGLVPSRLWPLVKTSILRPSGRLRAALELFVPRKRDDSEESIAQFVGRRFGDETYHWLVEPLLSGIFAGDGEKLSLTATFPQLVETEKARGSIVRQMLLKRLLPQRPTGKAVPPVGFLTPRGGLAEIVEAIVDRLPEQSMKSGVAIEGLEAVEEGYELRLTDGSRARSRTVVLANPAFAAAPLVEGLSRELAAELEAIPFVSTATVSVAFQEGALTQPLDGSGYVSPRAGGDDIVACTWTSNKFPARAPEGGVLVRFFLGRAGREEIAAAADDELKAVVRRELHEVMGIRQEPSLWRLYRWPRALPQYNLGHCDRVLRLDRLLESLPGFFLAGASYHGVGIPDCIQSGFAAASAATAFLDSAVDRRTVAEAR